MVGLRIPLQAEPELPFPTGMNARWLFGVVLAMGLLACGASEQGASVPTDDSVADVSLAETAECTCQSTVTQDVSCVPHAVCTGGATCADREPGEEAANAQLATSTEHYYLTSLPGDSFTADSRDCTGSSTESLPETLQVKPHDVDGCHCAITVECSRLRTTSLGCGQ